MLLLHDISYHIYHLWKLKPCHEDRKMNSKKRK